MLIPLTTIPYWLAELVWFSLSVASFWVGGLLLVRIAGREINTGVGWHLLLPGLATFVFLLWPIQSNLLNGQVNLCVLLCCILFLHFFMRGSDAAAAVWLVGLKFFYDRSWATGRIVVLAACFVGCFLLYNPLQTTPLGFLALLLLVALLVLAGREGGSLRADAGYASA